MALVRIKCRAKKKRKMFKNDILQAGHPLLVNRYARLADCPNPFFGVPLKQLGCFPCGGVDQSDEGQVLGITL